MIKTNIKLRVTPEQSEAVQNICFANGVFWYAGNGSEVKYTKAEYLFIDSDRVWFRVITDHNIGPETEGYTEVDADLFIRTNGTCEETVCETISTECQFAKYGFEKPDFECELFGTVSDPFRKNSFVIGVIKKGMFNNCPHMWSVKYGTCYTSSLASNMPEYDLTPIEKPWYKTYKFPCLVKDGDDTFTISQTDGYSERFLATLTPLTNDEIEELKQ